jgi:hypothetical protein
MCSVWSERERKKQKIQTDKQTIPVMNDYERGAEDYEQKNKQTHKKMLYADLDIFCFRCTSFVSSQIPLGGWGGVFTSVKGNETEKSHTFPRKKRRLDIYVHCFAAPFILASIQSESV